MVVSTKHDSFTGSKLHHYKMRGVSAGSILHVLWNGKNNWAVTGYESQNNPFIHKLPVVVSVFPFIFNPGNVLEQDALASKGRIIEPSVLFRMK